MLEATESSVERCARLVLSKPAATVSPVRSQSSVATVPVIELSRTGCVTLVAKAPTTCVRPYPHHHFCRHRDRRDVGGIDHRHDGGGVADSDGKNSPRR